MWPFTITDKPLLGKFLMHTPSLARQEWENTYLTVSSPNPKERISNVFVGMKRVVTEAKQIQGFLFLFL